MPPQPLTSIRPPVETFWWGTSITERPQLAALVMDVIAKWSVIDQRINLLVADFLKMDILIATKMLQAVENASTRRAIVRSAAKHVLETADNDLFEAALKTTQASEKRRHMFAHHVWALPGGEAHTKALVLIDPKLMNLHESENRQGLAATQLAQLKGENPRLPVPTPFLPKVLYFTEQDLREDVAIAGRAYWVISLLPGLAPDWYGPLRASIRGELSKDPLIQQEIERRSEQNCPRPPE